ncbi:hypothetical protein ACKKBF_B40575 [Auxenochlorella protothecoides x Auxenochlorella symbiontica]
MASPRTMASTEAEDRCGLCSISLLRLCRVTLDAWYVIGFRLFPGPFNAAHLLIIAQCLQASPLTHILATLAIHRRSAGAAAVTIPRRAGVPFRPEEQWLRQW